MDLDNKPSAVQLALRYGSLLAFAKLLADISTNILLGGVGFGVSLIGLIVFIAWIYFTVRAISEYRSANNGVISFGKAFEIGITITAIYAVAAAFFSLLYSAFLVEDDYFEKQLVQIAILYEDMGFSEQEIDKSMEALELLFTPSGVFLSTFLGNMLLGLIADLIIAAVMKKEGNPDFLTNDR